MTERTPDELEFEQETGLQSWLPCWSEKFNEPREYLNPQYVDWYFKKHFGGYIHNKFPIIKQ